jgi:hypothetical protein
MPSSGKTRPIPWCFWEALQGLSYLKPKEGTAQVRSSLHWGVGRWFLGLFQASLWANARNVTLGWNRLSLPGLYSTTFQACLQFHQYLFLLLKPYSFFFFFDGTKVWTQGFKFAKKALTLPLEPHFQPIELWLFWKWGSLELYALAGPNLRLPNLTLPHS